MATSRLAAAVLIAIVLASSVSAGTLFGSVTPGSWGTRDLTIEGTIDWATWGRNGSTQLAPTDRKAGGNAISDLTNVGGVTLMSSSSVADPFTWSDGTPVVAEAAYVDRLWWAHSWLAGPHLQFSVPADARRRTLRVYVTSITAHIDVSASLSDASASAVTQSLLHVAGGPFPGVPGPIRPGVIDFTYAADTPGQLLTVTITSRSGCCTGILADLRGVTLSYPADELTVDLGPGRGLWTFDRGLWAELDPLSPVHFTKGRLDTGTRDDLIADYGFAYAGIWVYYNGTSWAHLSSLQSIRLATGDLDASGQDDILVDNGPGVGLRIRYDSATWSQLSGLSGTKMLLADLDGNGEDEAIIDFGGSVGVWSWNVSTGWALLYQQPSGHFVAADIDNDGNDELIADFGPSLGLWVYEHGGIWTRLTGSWSVSMTTGDIDSSGEDDIIIDFGPGVGIWIWLNNSSWQLLSNLPGRTLTTGDLNGSGRDDVVVDYGPGYGIWAFYDASVWRQLHTEVAGQMVAGQLDGH